MEALIQLVSPLPPLAQLAALIPLVVGLLAAFVAYGRWRLVPHRGSRRSVMEPAR